jgi:uncharacterized protein (TIGR02246 family)
MGSMGELPSVSPLLSCPGFGIKFVMVKTGFTCLSGLLLVALAGCNTAPPAPAVDVAAETGKLHDLEAAWAKEAAAKDVDKIVSHYTDDATLGVSGMPAMKGRDAIRAAWAGMVSDPNFKLDFSAERVEVSADGGTAYTRGPYQLTVSNPKTKKPVTDKGSYLTVFKKQADGSWKAVEDFTASQIPPPAPR